MALLRAIGDDGQLDGLTYADTDEDEALLDERTFREQLALMVANGDKFPCMFSSTEF